MSLFGQPQNQTASSGGLFGGTASNTAPKPSLFGTSTTTSAQPASGGGLFGGATQNQQQNTSGGGLFGSSTTAQTQQPQQSGGLFGQSTAKPAGGLLGGGLGQPTQPAQSGGLFGQTSTQQPAQQPSTGGGLFGLAASTQQQSQPQQQQGGLFGGSTLGGQQQQTQQNQQSQFGQTTMATPQAQQQQSLSSSLWSPGRAITGVHRTVPMQLEIVVEKWNAGSRSSPFRSYLYNNVGEDTAPFYQPGPEDDETKWEEALRKRPDPGYVPVLVKGFWELGKRAQRQKDFLAMMQRRLHEINNCLTDMLSRHDLKISVKIADCRRKHMVLSKRCLALAAKTQVLRNRGYAMDDAEEELKKKLNQLERSVFDPSVSGRSEEIWARMLAIHEHGKRLQAEMERVGANTNLNGDDELDEQTLKTAKKILDDYHAQIQHLQKELGSVKKEFDEAQKLNGN
ncbi:hypothetical protein N7532_011637 [Penicillium argentinense]|uniref:Nucleoporin Nup54 alpha-helical domain-containing protein n=1 Tax=Penicillium argentinense TaxID=1131581 RepID=A0A9W9EIW3_9EURO|nr:uncharacterized protein N7532_011637 [Penicillium argentinense]KAJ5082594.1 hypothetical protein N7532_011637 [Penicillium argentinense]